MSQHDFNIANQGFPAFRADLNSGLEALATNSSGSTQPSTTFAYQFWYDESSDLLKMRNSDNDAWITLASFDQATDEWEVRSSVVQAVDAAGLSIKTDEGTTRFSVDDSGQVSLENYSFPIADGSAGQALTTDGAGNLSFSDVGGDIIQEGNSSVEVVDAGTGSIQFTTDGSEAMRIDENGRLGIGTTNPNTRMEVAGESGSADFARFTINEKFNSGATFFGLDFKRTYSVTGDNQPAGFIHVQRTGSRNNAGMLFGAGDEDNAVQEHMRLDTVGNLKFNSGFGSVATAYGCRAWVNFDGTGTVSIRDSGNVSSITDNGTGEYAVNFTTAMPDNNFSVVITGKVNRTCGLEIAGLTTTSVSFAQSIVTNADASDGDNMCVSIFR